MSYEALNQYVLIGIGIFAAVLYVGLMYAGVVEFITGISKKDQGKSRLRNRGAARRLRNTKKADLD